MSSWLFQFYNRTHSKSPFHYYSFSYHIQHLNRRSFGENTLGPPVPNLLILKQVVQTSLTFSALWPVGGVARAYVSLFVIQELSSMIADSITTFMEQLAQRGTYVTCSKLIFGKHPQKNL